MPGSLQNIDKVYNVFLHVLQKIVPVSCPLVQLMGTHGWMFLLLWQQQLRLHLIMGTNLMNCV